jgi:hypothetical protein
MDAATLYKAIEPVCPIISTNVGDPVERDTWSYTPQPQATPAEIAAADNVLATVPVAVAGSATSAEFIARFTNAEYRLASGATWRGAGGNAKNWDVIVVGASLVHFSKQKVQTLKADLVSGGVLTQVRADEIFK